MIDFEPDAPPGTAPKIDFEPDQPDPSQELIAGTERNLGYLSTAARMGQQGGQIVADRRAQLAQINPEAAQRRFEQDYKAGGGQMEGSYLSLPRPTAQDLREAGARAMELALPGGSGEQAAASLRSGQSGPLDETAAGVVEGGERAIEGLVTPSNLLLIGAIGGAPKVIQKLVSLGFSFQMAKGASDKVMEATRATTPRERAANLTEAILSLGMASATLRHAASPIVPQFPRGTPAEQSPKGTPGAQIVPPISGTSGPPAESAPTETQFERVQRTGRAEFDDQGNLILALDEQGNARPSQRPAAEAPAPASPTETAPAKPEIDAVHIARTPFEKFDPEQIGKNTDKGYFGTGFYFTTEEEAPKYDVYGMDPSGKPGVMMRTKLNLQNPFVVGAEGGPSMHEVMSRRDEIGPDKLTEELKAQGHDGVMVYGEDGKLIEMVAFHPDQIRVVGHEPAPGWKPPATPSEPVSAVPPQAEPAEAPRAQTSAAGEAPARDASKPEQMTPEEISGSHVFDSPEGTRVLSERDVISQVEVMFGKDAVADAMASPMPGSNPISEMIAAVERAKGWQYAGGVKTARVGKFADERSALIHAEAARPGTIEGMRALDEAEKNRPTAQARAEQIKNQEEEDARIRESEARRIEAEREVRRDKHPPIPEQLVRSTGKVPAGYVQRGEFFVHEGTVAEPEPKPAESQPPPPVPPKEAPPSAPPADSGGATAGIKNATMDRIREGYGLEGKAPVGRRPDEVVIAEAQAIRDADSEAGRNLVRDLRREPGRPLTDTEDALLSMETVGRMDEVDAAKEEEAGATTGAERKAAGDRLTAALSAVQELGTVADRGGTANARGLRFRQRELNRDYTLAKMLAKEARARGGAPETEAEQGARMKATEAKASAIKKANEDAQAAAEREREGQTADYVDQLLKDVKISDVVKEKAAKGKPAKPNPLAKSILDGEAAARARIAARLRGEGGTTLSSGGLGALGNLADYAIIGAAHIYRGAKKIGAFTEKLAADFGPWIREHAPAIFEAAKAHLAATRRASVQSLAKVIERAKADAPEGLDHGTVGRVVRALATEGVGKQGGIEGVNELMTATHAELEPLHPGVTERQVRDLFNNYGKATYPSKEAIAVQVSHAKRVTLLQGQIADVQAKIDNLQSDVTLKRTGAQRPKPTLEERDLIKQKNDLIKQRDAAMRAAGIEVPEDANQLAGALTAAKTRARNELEALQKAIDTKTRIEKGRGSAPSDTELDGLRKQLAAKRKLYAEAFPETPETDAEKIDRALKALDRNIAEEDKMLREGRLTKPKGEAKPDSPELQRRAAELQAMRDFRHELADAAKTPEEREAGAIKDAIDAIERKKEALRTGDVGPKPAEQGPMSAHLEGLQWERDRLNKAIAAMRRAKAGGVPEERATESARKAALKAAEKRLVTVDAAIERGNRTGDYGQPAPKKPGVASGIAEVVAKRAEAKEKAETLAALRKFYKPPGPPKDLNATRNEQIRTASLRRQHELADRLASGHYTKASVRKTILEAETERFKAAEQNLKRQWDTHLKQIEYDNRTKLQKAFDVASGVSRGGKLTRILTLGKLAVLSVHGFSFKPIYEAVGAAYSKLPLYSQIFRRATIEGGGSLSALADFYKGGAKGLHDAKQPLRQILSIVTRGGHGDIAARAEIRELYGKQGVEINPRWWDIPQLIHEAEKGPLKRAHFEYAKAKLTESLSKSGHDVSTEAMQKEINEQAYAYSKLSIMMSRSWFSDLMNRGVAMLEQPNPVTGKVSISKYAGAAALKSVLTFNTVATNHLITLLNHTPLGLLHGNIRAIKALASGIAELHPDDANSIARQLKQGFVGSAFMAIGALLPQAFGGLDPRKKREPGEPGFGEIQIGEHRIPKFVSLAVPPLLAAHIGATIMQEAHSLLRKKHKVEQGLGAGALAGFAAAVEGGPVVNESVRMQNLFEHGQRWKFISDWAASNGIPGIVDEAARWVDRWSQNHSLGEAFFGETPKRVPKTIIEGAEQHIPFFRESVAPKATPKPKHLTHH